MTLAAATVFLFVWSVPVWLPILAGILWPGLRLGMRLAFVGTGVVCGLFASLGPTESGTGTMDRLLRMPLPTMALCAWLLAGGICLATAHHHVRENDAAALPCAASLAALLIHIPLGVIVLYPWLEHCLTPR